MTYDVVNKPEHYAHGGIECIDAMEAAYGREAVMHFCQCNAFKYQWRFAHKNGVEDLKKAEWYNNKFIELATEESKDIRMKTWNINGKQRPLDVDNTNGYAD